MSRWLFPEEMKEIQQKEEQNYRNCKTRSICAIWSLYSYIQTAALSSHHNVPTTFHNFTREHAPNTGSIRMHMHV